MLKKFSIKIKTAFSLGISNIVNVLIYRLQSRTGYFQKRLPIKPLDCGPLFYASEEMSPSVILTDSHHKLLQEANFLYKGELTFFSHARMKTGSPPNWFLNPFSNNVHKNPSTYWASSEAMDNSLGDIKIIWEMSRMDWALTFSKIYSIVRKTNDLNLLNQWLNDWIEKNPPQAGPNWICGQETAIRLIHIILCAHILSQTKPLPALVEFIQAHCKRIALTCHYAKAQDNNHIISEAAGLFIGGLWLTHFSSDPPKRQMGNQWRKKGRYFLEKAVQKLIAPDGSFAQYSLNYHRVLIATLNMAEYFRKAFKHPQFSKHFYQQSSSAILWLFQMVDPDSGQGPNLGANDGAHVYKLSETSYSDYRSDIQMGACLFLGKRLYNDGPWDESFEWLGMNPATYPYDPVTRSSQVMSEGGYVTFSYDTRKKSRSWAMIRCPKNQFRPHHADALHFDFWLDGINVLCDSGSYSYGQNEPLRTYFISSSAHNTVSFDTHDQMPVISRFLFGQWIQTTEVQPFSENADGNMSWCGAYQDYFGCRHQRQISTDGLKWCIIDHVSGYRKQAIVRWRLQNGCWILKENCLEGDHITIKISTNVSSEIRLTQGLESVFYMKKRTIPVLEICVTEGPACIHQEIIRVNFPSIFRL
ncbi:MAG: alginate lyase family protein [Candidatus Magnetomorum sp.]|nr:alginate lyase family protein [Candidatus Magnetomorum sp.]